jgi:hypothetical protein
MLRRPLLPVSLCLLSAALPALAQDLPAVQEHRQVLPVVPVTHRGVPWRDPNEARPIGFAAPAGAHLSYFGGPVISNVQVIEVLYGTGSYLAQVAGTTSPNIGTFYSDLPGTNSGYINLLSQYDTNISGGTNQIIGNGTFAGLFQITPSSANDGSTIDDTNIQAELLAQISAGHLPAPVLDAAGNVNTIYMIYFPPGKSITQGGSGSCVAGGFCAYHGTTSSTLNGKNLLYGVFPDFQPPSGCSQGCGTSSTFGIYTSVSSHELSEAITDADVGIATTFAPPLAWYDMTNGEIGDICNGQQGSYTANGTTYTIQLEFSNAANNCVLPPPPSNPDFSLSASPSSVSVTQGSSASTTITVNPSGGFTGSVTLSASGLPSGVTASFGTNPTTSTSSVTFTASATAATGTSTVTITGTSGSLTHTTTISLTVNAQVVGDFTISATPASATVTAGGGTSYTATVTGTGGFTGSVGLSVSGLPSGASASFNPTSVSGSGSSTMSVSTSTSTPAGTYTLTITGTSGSLSHSTTVTLVVNAAPTPDFTIAVSPSSLNVTRGTTGSYTVTITGVNGFAGAVSLSVSGQGSRVTATFNPSSVTGSGTSTLSVRVSSRATRGTRTLSIRGTSGSLSHSTTASLTIQ